MKRILFLSLTFVSFISSAGVFDPGNGSGSNTNSNRYNRTGGDDTSRRTGGGVDYTRGVNERIPERDQGTGGRYSSGYDYRDRSKFTHVKVVCEGDRGEYSRVQLSYRAKFDSLEVGQLYNFQDTRSTAMTRILRSNDDVQYSFLIENKCSLTVRFIFDRLDNERGHSRDIKITCDEEEFKTDYNVCFLDNKVI